MPMTCATCAHPDPELIDAALIGKASNRSIAAHFELSDNSAKRHAANHLPATLAKAADAVEASRADELLTKLKMIEGITVRALKAMHANDDHRGVITAVCEMTRQVELLARMRGEIEADVTIVLAPQWLELRQVVITALAEHPDARLAVVDALTELEVGGDE